MFLSQLEGIPLSHIKNMIVNLYFVLYMHQFVVFGEKKYLAVSSQFMSETSRDNDSTNQA